MIDSIDRTILRELQRDGRQTNRELSQRAGLSANATGVRVKRLVENGYITGIHARLNQQALGRPIETILEMRLARGAVSSDASEFFLNDPRVVEAWQITGRTDYIVRVAAESTSDLHDLLQELTSRRGLATDVVTSLVLERIWAQ
ncbi:MAG: Lrp/AsnC family transcriptional regulator [Actinomycetia bacterium]|nr:Lrp/AsnC family transcriptional regulator [Actinomycetes bacterium]MCP4963315.1 Lrp/AsnC family transcriptional regulator [Actinomycetes bacterium]